MIASQVTKPSAALLFFSLFLPIGIRVSLEVKLYYKFGYEKKVGFLSLFKEGTL